MGKRMRVNGSGDEDGYVEEQPKFLPSQIRNKVRRSAVHAEVQKKKKRDKKQQIRDRNAAEQEALEIGELPPARKIPRTIENTREADETLALPDDDELNAEAAVDEFSRHFSHQQTPKILITTSESCSTPTRKFIVDLLTVIPNAHYYKRGSYHLKQIVKYSCNREYTSMLVINENRRDPNGMLVVNLPEGPTAYFKMSNVVLSKKLKGHGKASRHQPELILNNFRTRLGHRVGRLFASLFPQVPNFRGRRAVTFHNQRDFIFFRHHRYIFEQKEVTGKKVKPIDGSKTKRGTTREKSKPQTKDAIIARLQECGPRFTLKMQSLQHGTFNTKYGEYEWLHKPDMDTSRRRFIL